MRRWLAGASAFVLACCVAFVGSAYLAPVPERLREAGSTVVTYRDGAVAHVFLAPDDRWRIPVALDRVEPAYVDALLRYEDKRFYAHPGVDPVAVLRAIAVNLASGKVRTGASTLTMQLVRVLEPRPRTLKSKLIEAHRALTLELKLSKAEILEAYLTFTPYGRNLEGIEAASLAYFSHSADALAPDEIATLLAVPQNPSVRFPDPKNTARLRTARDEIATFLLQTGGFHYDEPSDLTLDEVKRAPVPKYIQRFPRDAPHLAQRLRTKHGPGARIRTTLDRGTQHMVAEIVALEREQLANQGIYNGAVLVADSASGELRAWIGNLDFWDAEHGGQIAATTVPRSPGSALKPFLYTMGIDEGLVLPEFLIQDLPTTWGTYRPQNYDKRFRGLVRLDEALSRSLNLPFVWLLQQVGVEPFLGKLRRMGVRSLDPRPGHYGLSVAAGGIEVTPIEVLSLYLSLARLGVTERPRVEPGLSDGHRVWSEGASWLVAKAMRIKDRPDFPSRRVFSGVAPTIAWKTGTSFGHRDAWAAGFGASHTAVVWLGNLDYSPARALVGSEAAGPILFDVLEAVEAGERSETPRPDGLTEVSVCAYSGRLPTEACPLTRKAFAPRSSVPTERCPFHKQLAIDLDTGEALTPGCREGRTWENRTFLQWPATVRRYLADQHRELPSPPSYAPGCVPSGERAGPVILSPQQGQISVLIPGVHPSEQEIPLSAEAEASDAALSWFVDGRFLGTTRVEQRVWWTPQLGEHVAVVVDGSGRRAERRFTVRRP